jgi:hypothetical protein
MRRRAIRDEESRQYPKNRDFVAIVACKFLILALVLGVEVQHLESAVWVDLEVACGAVDAFVEKMDLRRGDET